MEKKFSIQEVLAGSWEIIKNNFWFIFGLQLIVIMVNFFPQIANFWYKDEPHMEIILLAIGLGCFILQMVVSMGLIKIYLGLYDKREDINIDALFSGAKYFFRYLWASILYGLIVLFGLILLIIPGIIWSIKYQFFAYFIVDKDMGIMDSLKASARITAGQKVNLAIFACVAMLVNLVGLIFFGVGLFISIPLTSLAVAYIFRKLSAEDQPVEQVAQVVAE